MTIGILIKNTDTPSPDGRKAKVIQLSAVKDSETGEVTTEDTVVAELSGGEEKLVYIHSGTSIMVEE